MSSNADLKSKKGFSGFSPLSVFCLVLFCFFVRVQFFRLCFFCFVSVLFFLVLFVDVRLFSRAIKVPLQQPLSLPVPFFGQSKKKLEQISRVATHEWRINEGADKI